MSYDRKIEQICNHEVIEEALFLSEDRVTVRPLRPIANIRSVKVRFNRLIDVPAAGVAVPAKGKGTLPGPYNIAKGVNDTLVVSVNAGPDKTLVVSSGNQLTVAEIAKDLNSQAPDLLFSVTKKKQIQVATRTQGYGSRLQFKAGSTIASTLGLTLNKVYRGQQVMPKWTLVNDPNTLADRPTRLIMFDDRIEGTNDFFEVNYTTIRQECRRCGGTGVENDWRYNRRGEVIKVQNHDLLMQEVLKITYTELGSNPFHNWYGTRILESVGQKLTDKGILQNMIVSDLREAFKRWQSVKRQQEEDVGQFVSDEEYPFQLLVVNLEQDSQDPTVIFINALVQSRSSQPIQISRGLKLPIPFDLLGSTVQESLLRANEAKALQSFR